MGSRSYPIWNEINSCLYKSMQSYGVKDHSEIDMNVGQGARHSHLLCTIKQTRREYGDWVSFCVFIDDKKVKQGYFNKKTKQFTRRKPNNLNI